MNILYRYRLAFALVFLILVVMQPILYHSFALDPDEGYFMFMGNSISHGAVPYINFADNKPPGIWYLLYAGFQIFGKSIYVARGITYVVNAISALIIYFIGKELWSEKAGIISSFIFLVGILTPAFEGSLTFTEPFLSCFSLLGVILFIKAKGRSQYLVASGVAIGIATLFKQTGILLLFAIILFYLASIWVPTNRTRAYLAASFRKSLLLFGGFAVPMMVVIAYFWGQNALGQLVQFSVLGLRGYGTSINLTDLEIEFMSFSIIWVLLAISVATIAYKFFKKSSDFGTLVAIWLLVSLLPLVSRQYGHYFIQVLPPACLLASLPIVKALQQTLLKISERLRHLDVKYTLVTIGAVVLLLTTLASSAYMYVRTTNSTDSLQSQIQVSKYIQAHTSETDKILVYPYQPSIYFLSDRDPCVKVLILFSTEVDKQTERELLEQIDRSPPRYVVVQTDKNGTDLKGLPSVYDYIVNNFKRERSIGRFEIYTTK